MDKNLKETLTWADKEFEFEKRDLERTKSSKSGT